jgi:hypothetical protein
VGWGSSSEKDLGVAFEACIVGGLGYSLSLAPIVTVLDLGPAGERSSQWNGNC